MEKIILTEEQIKRANSYAPLRVKADFIDACVGNCLSIATVDLNIGDKPDETSAMPNMYIEDTFTKSRYLMTALCNYYLAIPLEHLATEKNDPILMQEDEYDLYAGSHLVNQLERMKGNAEYRDKIFDLLRDFRDLEKRLNTAIYNRLTTMNDPANRIFQKLAWDTSAAALEAQKDQLADLNRQLEELKRARAEQKE